MSFRAFVRPYTLPLIAALACCGCASDATRPSGFVDAEADLAQLSAGGEHRRVAEEYMRRADADPKASATLRLHAAREYIAAGDLDTATEIVEATSTAPKSANAFYAQLLLAQIALKRTLADEALSRTASPPRNLPAALATLLHEIRAGAHELRRDAPAAFTERHKLGRLLGDDAARKENTLKQWKALGAAAPEQLDELYEARDPEIQGWAELALMMQNPPQAADALQLAISSWIENYPGHSAIPLITDRLMAQDLRAGRLPGHVALLLPFRGQYGDVAEAIRDGFLAAWLRNGAPQSRLSIYDADALNIGEQYQKAVADGAEFILGPLEKSALETLLKNGPPSMTTLALNQLDALTQATAEAGSGFDQPALLQFGLTPENEARQVARRAFRDGHARALILAPRNEWGQRMQRAFQQEWETLGGIVVEYADYGVEQIDFSATISRLLNLDSSNTRAAQLRQRLGRSVHGGGRLRGDADLVFMAANPVAARQIIPQFRFYGVNRMAVYGTSHVYGGTDNPMADSDLNGLLFADMPWVLGQPGNYPDLAETMDKNWSAANSPLRRFYALGIDACLLITQIPHLLLDSDAVFQGVTGWLRLLPDDTVERELAFARFVDGRPEPLGAALPAP